MKRFFYCFTVFVLFVVNLGFSSCRNMDPIKLKQLGSTEPEIVVNILFDRYGYKENFRDESTILAFTRNINEIYDKTPNLKIKAINILLNRIQNQTIHGQKKYTKQDINNFIKIYKTDNK